MNIEISEMFSKGMSFNGIAKKLNCSPSLVRRKAVKIGLYKPLFKTDSDGKIECRRCGKVSILKDFPNLYLDCRYLCLSCLDLERHKNQIKKFGLTKTEYDSLLIKQNYKCGICKNKFGHINKAGKICRLAVDHDHQNGKVRGLLCMKCNRGLGLLEKYLPQALDYLKNAESIN